MKALFLFMTLGLLINPLKIREINFIKEEALEAFSKKDYKTTIAKCRYLTDSLQLEEDPILLNLAHAYFLSNDTTNALTTYQLVTSSSIKELQSKAYQQLGIIKNKQGKQEEALQYFKDAIKADEENMDARYNYELLKKYIEYPEIILTKFRLLVNKRQYKEARNFLTAKMKQNQRIRQFKDYNDRIKLIIAIDSLIKL